jgi:hypothetical protein
LWIEEQSRDDALDLERLPKQNAELLQAKP